MANQAARHGVQPTVIPLTSVRSARRPDGTAAEVPTPEEATLTLLQVASLSRVKNQRMLIDALAVVRQSDRCASRPGWRRHARRRAPAARDRERRRRSRAVPRVRAAGSTRGDLRRRRSLRAVVAARGGGRLGARSRGGRTCRLSARASDTSRTGPPIARWQSRRSMRRQWPGRFSRCTPIRRGRARWRRRRRRGRSNTTPHGWPIGLRRCIGEVSGAQTVDVNGRLSEHTQRRHVSLAATSRPRRNRIALSELIASSRPSAEDA